jgi:glycosyltransferase involved in cell wall biosynthesis
VASLRQDFPELQVRIAGSGPHLEQLKSQVAALGLEKNVTFVGWLDDLSLERARWAIAVQPSLEEGIPLGLLEAMAERIPVVASRVGGVPEVIEDGVSGLLVEPAAPSELANALRKLLSEPQSQTRMGDAAAMTIGQKFSARRMADSISAIYDELLLT